MFVTSFPNVIFSHVASASMKGKNKNKNSPSPDWRNNSLSSNPIQSTRLKNLLLGPFPVQIWPTPLYTGGSGGVGLKSRSITVLLIRSLHGSL